MRNPSCQRLSARREFVEFRENSEVGLEEKIEIVLSWTLSLEAPYNMPRKVSYGPDYDDGYDDYGEYDYYYDDEDNYDEQGKPSHPVHSVFKPGVWHCPICTYENEESLSFCDICGAMREPLTKSRENGDAKKVADTAKDSGVSVAARFLFASLHQERPKTTAIFQQLSEDSSGKEANSSRNTQNVSGHFCDFRKDFMSPSTKCYIEIVPFNFDSPSPDDKVSAAKGSFGKNSKESVQPGPSKVASSTGPMKGLVKASREKKLENPSISSQKVVLLDQEDGQLPSVNKNKVQAPNGNFRNLNLHTDATSSSTKNTRKPTPRADYKPEKWMLLDQGEDGLRQLSIAIVGHVDSGKSTLSGRLLHHLGRVSQKDLHKYEKESKLKGKGSFLYAWALDESPEERERGITMTVGVAHFDTKKHHIVILDSPGHKDFVPNLISGATQADAAILVVDGSLGSFEAGMEGNGGGQTKEHAQLIRSFGIEQLIVAVNKMDAVDYSQERFDFIKLQLSTFLRSCGFKESSVTWVPLSAMENQNLVTHPSDSRLLAWFRGYHLLDAIDHLQPPTRNLLKPLCMPICDVFRSQSSGQLTLSGKLEMGAIKSGFKVLVMPSGDLATVRSVEQDSHVCTVARAGDSIYLTLQGIDENRIIAGGVLCHPDFPVATAAHLELKVLILDVPMPVLVGSQVEFHIHHAKEAARVVRILSVLDPKTGQASKKAPRCLLAKQSAVIEVMLDRAVCVEPFSECRALGRVFLRASGSTIAVGIVNKLLPQQ